MSLLGLGAVMTTFLVMLVVALRSPIRMAYWTLFLAPWQLAVDLGLTITAFQLGVVALCCGLGIRSALKAGSYRWVMPAVPLTLFIVYALLITVAATFFIPSGEVFGGAARQGAARSVSQMVSFVLMVAPFFVLPAIIRTRDDMHLLFRAYVAGVVTLAALGWVQLAIWYTTGVNPFPIGIVNDLLGGMNPRNQSASQMIAGLRIHRMNSLAGEPKALGMAVALALVLVQAALALRWYPGWQLRHGWRLWIMLFATLCATLSTAGFYVWILVSAAVFVVSASVGVGVRAVGQASIIALLAVLIVWGLAGMALSSGPGRFADARASSLAADVALARTLERSKGDSRVLEDFDQAVLDWLRARPEFIVPGAGLGNAHLHADPYLPDFAVAKRSGKVFTAKTGVLQIVSEVGLLGLLLLMWGTYIVLARLRRCGIAHDRDDEPIFRALLLVGVAAIASYLVRGSYLQDEAFFLLGIVMSYRAVRSPRGWSVSIGFGRPGG